MDDLREHPNLIRQLTAALPGPSEEMINQSRSAVEAWFRDTAPRLTWARLESGLGSLLLFKREGRLTMIAFGSDPEDLEYADFSLDHLEHSPDEFLDELEQLEDYFAGRRTAFELDLSLERMSEFQRQVLMTTAGIPFGQTLSYAQIARRIGRPRSSRAVGQALAGNPIPVVIPCHRVITSSGGLGGYAGGLDWKRKLLIHEGALAF